MAKVVIDLNDTEIDNIISFIDEYLDENDHYGEPMDSLTKLSRQILKKQKCALCHKTFVTKPRIIGLHDKCIEEWKQQH